MVADPIEEFGLLVDPMVVSSAAQAIRLPSQPKR
jgi:hypothetical protein